MKRTKPSICLAPLIGIIGLLTLVHTGEAAKNDKYLPDRAVVMAVTGTVTSATGIDAEWKPLNYGHTLRPGATVRTAAGSEVILLLSKNQSIIRINENSTFVINQLSYRQTSKGVVTQTDLEVRQGSILGNVKTLVASSSYRVKIPNGFLNIRGSEAFYLEDSGTIRVISGLVTASVTVTLPNGTKAEKTVSVGAGQSLVFPASRALNLAINDNLAPTPTPAAVQIQLATTMAQFVTAGQVMVIEEATYKAASLPINANQGTQPKVVSSPRVRPISQ